MSEIYWLIEYRENERTVGYLKDMRRGDGAFDVLLTRRLYEALRFSSKYGAEMIINDWSFQRQQPHPERYVVEEHIDCDGSVASV